MVPPYRFFYRIEGGDVWITAVWHGAQRVDGPEVPGQWASGTLPSPAAGFTKGRLLPCCNGGYSGGCLALMG